jgi:hypothetical protein
MTEEDKNHIKYTEITKRQRHMLMLIQVLAWDRARHKKVAELNLLKCCFINTLYNVLILLYFLPTKTIVKILCDL